MAEELPPIPDCDQCFGCGPANPFGLHPRFRVEGTTVTAEFYARPEHQGFPGLVQGGVLAAMLDEVMAHAVWAEGVFTVTGRLEVFFRHPTPIQTPLRAIGEVVARRPRVYETRGRLLLPDGRVAVEGTGTFVVVPEGRFGRALEASQV
ncbi:MAG TPA: PaaI family thioesterase [Chloroflexota bacterium]|nr:PaaI family thioesterase [Chloroflexota bacterium]